MEVGVRELKAQLSKYVARAAEGQSVTVTDRGRPVARIVAFDEHGAIERGIEEGWIDPPRRQGLEPTSRFEAERSIADVIDDDRGN